MGAPGKEGLPYLWSAESAKETFGRKKKKGIFKQECPAVRRELESV